MVLKNWHKLDNGSTLHVGDKIKSGTDEFVIDKIEYTPELKVAFHLEGEKSTKVSASAMNTRIKKGQYIVKKKGFLGRIFSGNEFQDLDAVKELTYSHLAKTSGKSVDDIRSEADAIRNKIRGISNEVSSEEFVVESKRKAKSVNSPDENTTPQTKEIVVNGKIIITRYEQAAGGDYSPHWYIKCGNCHQDVGFHMWGSLGNLLPDHKGGANYNDSESKRSCQKCGAINIYNAGKTHWSYTDTWGKVYRG